MLKTQFQKDEIEEAHKANNASLSKMEKKVKKEVIEKEKPINPNFIFEGLNKKVSNKKFRKPKPDEKTKPKIEFIGDF